MSNVITPHWDWYAFHRAQGEAWRDAMEQLTAGRMTRESLYGWLGRAWVRQVRRMLRGNGSVFQTARNLRKQGVGLQTALILLTR